MSTSPISLGQVFAATQQSTKTGSAKAQATGATSSSTSSTSSLTGTSAGTTFLNLLVQELQNQDPTSPMDSTAMVGQMISLNQLDQLISINQVLSNATGSSTSSSTSGTSSQAVGATGSNTPSATQIAERADLLNSTQSTNAIQNSAQNSVDPNKALDLSSLNFANGAK